MADGSKKRINLGFKTLEESKVCLIKNDNTYKSWEPQNIRFCKTLNRYLLEKRGLENGDKFRISRSYKTREDAESNLKKLIDLGCNGFKEYEKSVKLPKYITFVKKNKKFQVLRTVNESKIFVGLYKTLEEAKKFLYDFEVKNGLM